MKNLIRVLKSINIKNIVVFLCFSISTYCLAENKLDKTQDVYNPNITPKSKRSINITKYYRHYLIKQFSAKNLNLGAPVFIRIFKQSHQLEMWVKQKDKPTFILFKTYKIAKFSGTLGPKKAEGDRQAPEGFYFVTPNSLNPNSRFHLSFNLGFPNAYDRNKGYTGSALMVHGSNVSIGCFAMTNRQIEEIYTIVDSALSSGQPFFRVHSFPFHLTDDNIKKYAKSSHIDFWKNLKIGYDLFEKTHIPPNVNVKNGYYIFTNDSDD
ncbi:murein L,D-transpeptidase family protein [Pasteurella atlantica]|uniref:Murein L,D-transpeptidase family protein n=2 Tax=Pasteurellaceae TaxID=712 RepID=A0ACC6HKN0_9PAST|nr:murein L,D-transpeptidase family protein [Pasteurella atlantica]MDP8051378.1 murein L,D-transpeptidase family protein [Pasteurella atlantica]MDP8104742.1 murein L,D-transpeptidase family protein [Pasteurella atlantica]MDP8148036.1 murein L,D-transpeptidase family protein [Pasteurella atlantica]